MTPRGEAPRTAAADGQTTLLAHALSLSALHGPGPWPGGGHPLPDEKPRTPGHAYFPTVVMDGIRTHGVSAVAEGTGDDDDAAGPADLTPGDIADRIVRLTDAPLHDDAVTRLHDRLARRSALDIADDLVTELLRRRPPRERLRELGLRLAGYGTRRDPVKLGIVLLGVAGDERDRGLLLLLGALDELTLYAVVALVNTQPDRHRAAYELARRVDGWGRIHAVERLAGCADPEVKSWLLRTGFRNTIMDEYLAHIAATTGDLYGALLEPDVDDPLLDGAGGVLAALARGGPAEDMSDYPDAVPALARYAELAAGAAPTIGRLRDLLTITRFVRDAGPGFSWPDGEPDRLRARYDAVLARPYWRDLVLDRLADPVGDHGFAVALSCAVPLGVPAMPQVLAHLEAAPYEAYVWQWALRHAGPDTIGAVVRLAERLLPPSASAGPSETRGFGPEFAADTALEVVVSGLGRHPGRGAALLDAALRNRVVRTRRAAVRTLTAWPPAALPDGWREWVEAAAAVEPNRELAAAMRALPARPA